MSINGQHSPKNKMKWEISALKEENRNLREKIDLLTLEFLKQKSLSKSSYEQKQMMINLKQSDSLNLENYPPIPFTTSTQKTLASKLLLPSKKIAYSYAVFGVKETFRKIKRKLIR